MTKNDTDEPILLNQRHTHTHTHTHAHTDTHTPAQTSNPYGVTPITELETIETVRFQLSTIGRSWFASVLTVIALAFALTPPEHTEIEHLWGIVPIWGVVPVWVIITLVAKFATIVHAKLILRQALTYARARRATFIQCGLNTFYGISLASICWFVVTPDTYENAALVVFLCTGVSSGALAYLAPNYPVYLCLLNALLWTPMLCFVSMGTAPYNFLVLGAVALFIVLRSAAKATRGTIIDFIHARYENAELLVQLQEESDNARTARLEAEKANMAKSRFLAAASHDLRQPTHALGLFLDALQNTNLDAMQRDILCKTKTVFEAAASMLNALLDYSRIEASAITPQPRAITVQSLFASLEDEFADRANTKNLYYRTHETPLVVRTDPLVLAMIMRNLISNAIRYTARGGILIACRRRGNSARIEVWDTGCGVPDDQHREIFNEFTQLGNPERDHRKGLGLGLAIANGFARLLESRVDLRSRLGQGSVFSLTLPLSRELPETDAIDVASISIPPGLEVLVVDDEEFVRAGMVTALARWHCRATAVETIEAAMQAIERCPPDLVICDYRLREGQTGAELVSRIRHNPTLDIPCILVTGDTAPERIREAMAIGVPLLHKPVNAMELLDTISRVIK